MTADRTNAIISAIIRAVRSSHDTVKLFEDMARQSSSHGVAAVKSLLQDGMRVRATLTNANDWEGVYVAEYSTGVHLAFTCCSNGKRFTRYARIDEIKTLEVLP